MPSPADQDEPDAPGETAGHLVGGEHAQEIGPDYHDRLAADWPEPRDQLHAGGWAATHALADALGLRTAAAPLDVCCGEGGTAVWLAARHGRRVVGVDILPRAAAVAAGAAAAAGVAARFVAANVFR